MKPQNSAVRNDTRIRRSLAGILTGAVAVALFILAPMVESVRAQVPQTLSFAGRLTDLSNNTLDGTFNLTFEIFDVASGGSSLWSETQNNVPVTNGAVQTKLGAVTPVPFTVAASSNAWLQITVGSDVLSPRQQLQSVLFAYTAGNVGGLTSAAFVTTSTVQGINGLKTFSGGVNMTSQLTLTGSSLTITSDQFSVGGATLAVTTGKVGIGTSNPVSMLNIVGGDVLIGTVTLHDGSALEDLHVAGNVIVDGQLIQHAGSGAEFESLAISTKLASGELLKVGNSTQTVVVLSNGRVGIGTQTPASLLVVAGTVTASGFVGSGEGITNLSDSGLSANVARLASTQTFSAAQTLASSVTARTGGRTITLSTSATPGVSSLFVAADGLVGIQTELPTTALTIVGTATANGFVGSGSGLTDLLDTALSANVGLLASTQTATAAKTFTSSVTVRSGGRTVTVSTSATPGVSSLFVAQDGTVGIQTETPTTALTVVGTVTANGFIGSGESLTNISDAGLSANVARLASTQTFSAAQTFGSSVTARTGGRTVTLSTSSTVGVSSLYVSSTGRVGILTEVPSTALDVAGTAQFGTGLDISTFTGGQLIVAGTVTAAGFVGDGSSLSGIVTNPFSQKLVFTTTPSIGITGLPAVVIDTHVYVSTHATITDDDFFSSPQLRFRGRYDSNTGGGATATFFDFRLQNVMENDNPVTGRLSISDNAGTQHIALHSDGDVGIGTGLDVSTFSAGQLVVAGTVTAAGFVGDGSTLSGIVTNPMGTALTFTVAPALRTTNQFAVSVGTNVAVSTGAAGNEAVLDSPMVMLRGAYDSSAGGGLDADTLDFTFRHMVEVAGSSPESKLSLRFDDSDDSASPPEFVVVTSSGLVGISTGAPSHTLHLVGSFRYVDGNQGAGKILTSNALGVATWVTAAGAQLASTQTFTGANTFASSTTFTGMVTAATVTAQGFVGSGDGLTSLPAFAVRLASTQTFSGANTFASSTTFTGMVTAATVTAQGFVGSGEGLTGIVPAGLTFSPVILNATQTLSGANTFASSTTFTGMVTAATVTAQGFVGSGEGLTGIVPAGLTFSPVILNATQTLSGANTFESSTTFTGMVTAATVTAQGFVGSGEGLTGIVPAGLTFSPAILNATQTFSGANTFASSSTFTGKADFAAVTAASATLTLDSFSVGGGTLVVSGANTGLGTAAPTATLHVNGHVHVTGPAPTVAADACGTTTQGTLVAGSADVRGTATVGGDNPTTCAITFASAWTNAPVCVSSRGSAAAIGVAANTTTLTFTSAAGMTAGELLHFHCLGR